MRDTLIFWRYNVSECFNRVGNALAGEERGDKRLWKPGNRLETLKIRNLLTDATINTEPISSLN